MAGHLFQTGSPTVRELDLREVSDRPVGPYLSLVGTAARPRLGDGRNTLVGALAARCGYRDHGRPHPPDSSRTMRRRRNRFPTPSLAVGSPTCVAKALYAPDIAHEHSKPAFSEPGPYKSRRSSRRNGRVTKPEWLDRPSVEQSPDSTSGRSLSTRRRSITTSKFLGNRSCTCACRSTRPVAQLAVRLTEVTPARASWLVSYGLLNLTHRQPGDAPSALTPGRDYDVTIELFPIAHRFKRNHRLRIALSEGLWPLAWPSPEPADLTFTLGRHSRLELPVRPQEATPAKLCDRRAAAAARARRPAAADSLSPRSSVFGI